MIFLKAQPRGQRRSYLPPTLLIAAAIVCALHSSTAFAVEPDAAGAAVKQGNEIFHKRCIVCHNKQPGDNTPFGPPNLYTAFRGHSALSTAQAENIVTNGRGQMPPFKSVLTRTEIRSVIAYLRSH